METKNQLLKKLGFSDEFVQEVENASFDKNFDSPEQQLNCYSTTDYLEHDLTSLTIENSSNSKILDGIYLSE